jgi:hypothetical protein
MSRTTLGRVLMSVGAVLVIGGVVGVLVGDDDGSTSGDDAGAPAASTTSTTTTATTTSTSTSTTSTTTTTTTSTTTTLVSVEDPETFLAILSTALETGDSATLMARMNQATIDRYGADQCTSYLASIEPAEQGFSIREVGEPGPWDYLTDDVSLSLDDVTTIEVERLVNGETRIQELHWQLVDGQFTWFTDCGDPI